MSHVQASVPVLSYRGSGFARTDEPGHPRPGAEALAMQLLRHQTKNALQRIIAHLHTPELRATPEAIAVAEELERRICLSARISDALFGMTQTPEPLAARLKALANATIALGAMPGQSIVVEATVLGRCPAALEGPVLQALHEMLCNALKHGMHERPAGRVIVQLLGSAGPHGDGAATLVVCDDGWGLPPGCITLDLSMLHALAACHAGSVDLTREGRWTLARVHLQAAP